MEKIKRFQIIQLYSNGDCLYASVIARQLKNDFPGCHVLWTVEKKCRSVLENNPNIDEIFAIEVSDKKDTDQIISTLKNDAQLKMKNGELDNFFITQIAGDNYANYDGSVRSSIYRNFPYKITVDQQIDLFLTKEEQSVAKLFAEQNQLHSYSNVILFECAPMSGQLLLNDELIAKIAIEIADRCKACVVLSSYRKINVDHLSVLDGSILTLRETVALSHHCTLLIGSSSGITWACTSNAAKLLPMIQLLDPFAYVFNPPSTDFKKRGKSTDHLIELYSFDHQKVIDCVQTVVSRGFDIARTQFNQQPILKFKLYRGIIHTFLRQGKFGKIIHFIRLNVKENKWNINMLVMIAKGILFFPAQLIADKLSSPSKNRS